MFDFFPYFDLEALEELQRRTDAEAKERREREAWENLSEERKAASRSIARGLDSL